MQFKGALRSPGDRGQGIRVVLVVDDYHLEILRGNDLMGRWYLADVEVVRDIAERFKLFLGPDEMEFLADDALTFAYEGVTRMQQGWVKAQKKKRRHRRAAADAARRKDSDAEPEPEPEPARNREPEEERPPRELPVAPTSELAKKLAAIAAAEAAASEPVASGRRLTWAEVEAQEANSAASLPPPAPARTPSRPSARKPAAETSTATGRKLRTRRNEEIETPPAPLPIPISEPETLLEPLPVVPEPEVVSAPVVEAPVEPTRQEEPAWVEPEPTWVQPSWIEPSEPEPSWIAPQPQPPAAKVVKTEPVSTAKAAAEAQTTADPQEEQADELTKRRQRRRGKKEEAPEPEVSEPGVLETASPREITDLASAREAIEAKATREAKGSGHHPAETSVGLLAKLRRPAKANEEHEHAYQESRSIGGLTRRVCVECNHVSIVSDD